MNKLKKHLDRETDIHSVAQSQSPDEVSSQFETDIKNRPWFSKFESGDYSILSDFQEIQEEEEQDEELIDDRKWLIHKTRTFRIRWDLFTMLLALWNALWIPYIIAFKPPYENDPTLFAFNTIIDFIFCADIVMNFYTTYVDSSGEEIKDIILIRKNYLKNSFAVDIIASIPIDNFVMQFSEVGEASLPLTLTDLLKLIRILRLGRIIRLMKSKSEVKNSFRLGMLVLYLLLWVHLTGCLWMVVVSDKDNWVPVPDWFTITTEFYEMDPLTQYNIWFYHSVWFLVGGEVGVRDTEQACAASILILAGALLNAVMVGAIADVMSNLNQKAAEFQAMQDGSLNTMNTMKLPNDLINRVIDFITQQYPSIKAQEEFESFALYISPSLKRQVNQNVFEPLLANNPIFWDNPEIREFVFEKIQSKFTKPEEDIVQDGMEADAFYILAGKGRAKVFVTDTDQNVVPVKELYPGNHFGELALVYDCYRTATVQSVDYCWIAEMSKDHFIAMLNRFSHLRKRIRDATSNYKDVWKKFLYGMLFQIDYIRNYIPKKLVKELVYRLSIRRYDKNAYIGTPGQMVDEVMFVADGVVELSICVNDYQLTSLKQMSGLQKSKTGAIREPTGDHNGKELKKRKSLAEPGMYRLGIEHLNSIKPEPEIVPITRGNEPIGFKAGAAQLQEGQQSVGNFPQEVVIAKLNTGSIMNERLALIKGKLHISIKAKKPTTLYTLPLSVLEDLSKDNGTLAAGIKRITESMFYFDTIRDENISLAPLVDYQLPEESKWRRVWRHAITRVIANCRDCKKKEGVSFTAMLDRVKAIIACQEAGDFELAAAVANGEVSTYYINDDGTYAGDKEKNSQPHAALPVKHPVMRFKSSIQNEWANRDEEGQKLQEVEELQEVESRVMSVKDSIAQMKLMISNPNARQHPMRIASIEAQPSATPHGIESLDRISASRLPDAAGQQSPPVVNPSRRKYVKGHSPARSRPESPSQPIPQTEEPYREQTPERRPHVSSTSPPHLPAIGRNIDPAMLKIDVDQVYEIREQQAADKVARRARRQERRKLREEQQKKKEDEEAKE